MATRRTPKRAGSRSDSKDTLDSPFVNLPWGKEQDEEFDKFLSAKTCPEPWTWIMAMVDEGMGVKVGSKDGSIFCMLDSPEAKEEGSKYMLSGWSDDLADAILVTAYKYGSILGSDWDHPTQAAAKSRRR